MFMNNITSLLTDWAYGREDAEATDSPTTTTSQHQHHNNHANTNAVLVDQQQSYIPTFSMSSNQQQNDFRNLFRQTLNQHHHSRNNLRSTLEEEEHSSKVLEKTRSLILNISNDDLSEIMSFLGKREIFQFSLSCKHFYNIIFCENVSNFSLWRILCVRDKIIEPSCYDGFSKPRNSELSDNDISNYYYDPYRDLYLNYENNIGCSQCDWFCKFDLIKLEWTLNDNILSQLIEKIKSKEICIVTALQCFPDRTKNKGNASDILNQLLGITNAFPSSLSEEDTELPCLYMYTRPLCRVRKSHKGKNQNVLFIRAYNLFDYDNETDLNIEEDIFDCSNESNLSSINNLRKNLMRFIILFSSTVIVCKDKSDDSWMYNLDNLIEPTHDPPLFGSYSSMPSLLVCSMDTSTKVSNSSNRTSSIELDDLMLEIKDRISENKNQSLNFMSVLLNWFGKIHGITVNMNNFARLSYDDELWCFVNDISSKLQFGWSISRWDQVKSNGETCRHYLEHCVAESNQTRQSDITNGHMLDNGSVLYEKILNDFAKALLEKQMQKSIEFYQRAVKADLNPACPLEMEAIVKLSEMNAEAAIRMFTQTVAPACFPSQVIEEVEQLLKHGINNNFRILWRENARNSENYCQQVWEACFKWMKAEFDCPGDKEDFCTLFESRFFSSLNVYLQNAIGTRKIFVMNFCSKQYLEDYIIPTHPSIRELCHNIMGAVEALTLQETIEVDKNRSQLQKLSAIRLKLLTIENNMERLKEEIHVREEDMRVSEEQSGVIEDRMKRLGLKYEKSLLGRISSIRKLYIDSALISLQSNIEAHKKFSEEYEQLNSRGFNRTHIEYDMLLKSFYHRKDFENAKERRAHFFFMQQQSNLKI
ncbi:F-box domain-containing protein [Naegleria gruberi]|uniref:F-box domain-containing protein n=1 Tax=Naegleria gruberi TaxID=5762 RepID=D2VQH6_NAEGR|nr:F-box domain-containing protein [Naegleria gruberi]EFC40951.1 F-box domain-containing protein [Naegleria gruberi]|eukprot:XP_002673695.1 F-box domain-containing protein [Naegleria gruberi strain NEG-M]